MPRFTKANDVMLQWFERLGGNRTVLALSGARMADAVGNSILIILLPLYVEHVAAGAFSLSTPALVGILIAIFGFTGAFLQPLMAGWADRTGRRKLFVQIGLLLMGAGVLAFVFASQFVHLLVIRIVQAAGFAMTVPASLALMTLGTERASRGGSMGIFSTFRIVGFAIGPLVGGFLQVYFGFTIAFCVGAAMVFLGAILVHFWVREAEASIEATSGFASWSLLTPGLAAIATALFVMAGSFAMMAPLENVFNEKLDQTAIGFAVAFSALMVSRLFLQTPVGRLSDRIGRKPLIVAGMLLLAPSTMLLGYVTTTLQLVGVRVIQGIATAGVAARAFALAGDLAIEGSEGRQMSILTVGFTLGIAVGPLVAGFLSSVSFALPFLIGGACCFLGAAVVYGIVPETVRK